MSDSAHETSSDTGITQRHILSSNSIRRSASIATISFSRLKRDGKISQDQTDVNVLERPSTPIADKYIGLLSMPSSKDDDHSMNVPENDPQLATRNQSPKHKGETDLGPRGEIFEPQTAEDQTQGTGEHPRAGNEGESLCCDPDIRLKKKLRDIKSWDNILFRILSTFCVFAIISFVFFSAIFVQFRHVKNLIENVEEPLWTPKGQEKSLAKQTALESNLPLVFYGINYSPQRGIPGECTATQNDVYHDIALLSKLTRRVKLPDATCENLAMTLCAIDFLKVDMKVTIGIDANKDVDAQLIALHEVLANTNSRKHISSIIVENGLHEGINFERDLLGQIQKVRRVIKMANTTAILGISEAGSSWEKLLDMAEHLDIVGANVSPFYGGLSVEESTTWTYDFFRKGVIAPVARANPHATYFLSEIGWPSAGPAIFKAEPGLPQLQEFLDQWVCRNQRAQVGWYWQEAFDSTEGSYKWGLFERDRTHKNVTIPVC